jgi:putative pyruvate formate lyase activating enzyme
MFVNSASFIIMEHYYDKEKSFLSHCNLCPRNCGADRISGDLGFCKSGAEFNISSICVHKGEEPVISGKKGICNIFFSHCNLQCIYCQNHEISNNSIKLLDNNVGFDELIENICEVLDKTENIVGFVSPSHNIPQMLAIVRGMHFVGKHPVVVYNTNGYDKPETLRMLEGIVDIYLPDFKYMDSTIASDYSGASDYPEVAAKALKEMYRQKGSNLIINDEGIAESGIIVRHLVLPGLSDHSIEVLRYIAEEISPNLHISLMSQYYPTSNVIAHPILKRTLTNREYHKVVDTFYELGFYRGWVQDLESNSKFRPDFQRKEPF